MKIFRYSEDRLPVLLIISLALADFVVFFTVDNVWLVLTWMLIGLGPKACICSWNHHHQHLSTFLYLIPNRILDVVYALHTGISTNAWVLHHVLGHHVNYLDQDKDESKWKRDDGKVMGKIEYTLYTAFYGYIKAYRVGKNHPKYQKPFLSMGMLVFLLLCLLAYFNLQNTIIIFILPMFIGYIVTCWHTYYHHSGLDADDHLEASYNIMHKWYNILTGNLGYHTAHHMKMGLHWSKLPEFHKTIEKDIPEELYREPCFPFSLMPAI